MDAPVVIGLVSSVDIPLTLEVGLVLAVLSSRVIVGCLFVPLFGLDVTSRGVVGIVLASALSSLISAQAVGLLSLGSGALVALVLREVLLGAALGLSIRVVLAVAGVAGGMVDGAIPGWRVSGFASTNPTGPTSVLYVSTFMVVLVALDAHVFIFEQLAHSYGWMPISPDVPARLGHLIDGPSMIFGVALSVSVPILLVGSLVEITFAMASRFSRGVAGENLIRGWVIMVFVLVTLFEVIRLLAAWFFETSAGPLI